MKPIDAITEAMIRDVIAGHRDRGRSNSRTNPVVELKTVAKLEPVHFAQMYVELSGCDVGSLINCNAARLTDGTGRVVRGYRAPGSSSSSSAYSAIDSVGRE